MGKHNKKRFDEKKINQSAENVELPQINDSTGQPFNQDEVHQMMNFGKIMAQRIVFDLLKHTLREWATESENDRIASMARAEKICSKIDKCQEFDYTGNAEMSFVETKLKLKMQLSIVEKDYKIAVDVPKDHGAKVYHMLGFLVRIAGTYYNHFIVERTEILKDMANFMPLIDFSSLKIDVNNSTLYIRETAKKRIGLFCYYVNSSGIPLAKEPSDDNPSPQTSTDTI